MEFSHDFFLTFLKLGHVQHLQNLPGRNNAIEPGILAIFIKDITPIDTKQPPKRGEVLWNVGCKNAGWSTIHGNW